MKVNNYNQTAVGQRNADSVRSVSTKEASEAKANSAKLMQESSQVSLSDKAKNYAKIQKIVEQTPDVREDKIEHFRNLIKSGSYKVDTEKLADAIIEETIKNEVSTLES